MCHSEQPKTLKKQGYFEEHKQKWGLKHNKVKFWCPVLKLFFILQITKLTSNTNKKICPQLYQSVL